jgi:ferredoxin
MKVLYLTATGNSLYVAKSIGGELISIPQTVKAGKLEFSDDKVGLVFPVYGLAVPQYIEEFLRKAKLDSPYIFAVLTYGMMDGNASGQLARIGNDRGINFSYIRTIKMVDNWLPNFDMEAQIRNAGKKQIEEHLKEIVSEISKGEKRSPDASALGKLMSKAYGGSSKFAIGPGVAKDFSVEESCVGCGTCVSVCPMDNVELKEKRPVFGARCSNCLACAHLCPKNSIHLKKEKSRARFRNEHVSLNEIIAANK